MLNEIEKQKVYTKLKRDCSAFHWAIQKNNYNNKRVNIELALIIHSILINVIKLFLNKKGYEVSVETIISGMHRKINFVSQMGDINLCPYSSSDFSFLEEFKDMVAQIKSNKPLVGSRLYSLLSSVLREERFIDDICPSYNDEDYDWDEDPEGMRESIEIINLTDEVLYTINDIRAVDISINLIDNSECDIRIICCTD